MEARLGIEVSIFNAAGNVLHFGFRFLELKPISSRRNSSGLLQVIEHQALGSVSPLLLRSNGINRELETLIRILPVL